MERNLTVSLKFSQVALHRFFNQKKKLKKGLKSG